MSSEPAQQSQWVPDERKAFEAKFPVPSHCIRVGNTYAATDFNAWAAHAYGDVRRGWLAALEFMGTPSAAPTPPEVHQAIPVTWTEAQVRDFLSVALRHVEVTGTLRYSDINAGLRYMAEKGQPAFFAIAPQPSVPAQEQLSHERECLARAIGDAAIKTGIVSPDANLTGPMLLMICDDLAEGFLRSAPAQQSQAATDERADFEAAALAAGVYTCGFERYTEETAAHRNRHNGDIELVEAGDYRAGNLQDCWKLWNARASIAAAPTPPAGPCAPPAQQPAGHFVRRSEFGPHVEVEPTEAGAFPLYAAPPAQQSIPAGYVIVPLEPTAEMALAGANVDIGACENAEDECFEIYRAMLAAALTPPEQLQSESQNIPEIIPAPEHLDVAVLVAALKDIIKHYPNPDISHVDYRVNACKCAESALSALQDPDDLIVYRVTLPSGETCNFGNESLARAWARGPAKIEPIKLKPVAELYAVDVPAQAKESE